MNRNAPFLRQMRLDACLSSKELTQLLFRGRNSHASIAAIESGEEKMPFILQLRWFYYCSLYIRLIELGYPLKRLTFHKSIPLIKKLEVYLPVLYLGISIILFLLIG